MAFWTCVAEKSGRADKIKAASPATCGAENEVPEAVVLARPRSVVNTLTPGATMPLTANSGPREEKLAISLLASVAPTGIMPLLGVIPAQLAGTLTGPPSLPADIVTGIPALVEIANANC